MYGNLTYEMCVFHTFQTNDGALTRTILKFDLESYRHCLILNIKIAQLSERTNGVLSVVIYTTIYCPFHWP